ncbi:hypothetical protein [Planococcus sp. NCCP-2050]|uniref:hypothetical protein n=1 Tax=Planococcus sp. NCCP-2050 TaxID=2944679 RepID=UPI002042322A|nr:hypothetical protein [Planococcus sp. NCCP-2050]GKW46909.1 hypothetical protein NCCP2050_26010 [Planococcus sp. NCCP-2050]
MIERGKIFANIVQALLGNVPTSLRALVITGDDQSKFSNWTAYFDLEADEEELEAINVANTVFMSLFLESEINKTNIENIKLSKDESLPWYKDKGGKIDGFLVYLRYEKENLNP